MQHNWICYIQQVPYKSYNETKEKLNQEKNQNQVLYMQMMCRNEKNNIIKDEK